MDNCILEVDLDGTAGYASSFLDEAFGNLIFDFSEIVVRGKLEIVSKQEPDWREMIFDDVFKDWEERRKSNKAPTKTKKHEEWYRLDNGKLFKKRWL